MTPDIKISEHRFLQLIEGEKREHELLTNIMEYAIDRARSTDKPKQEQAEEAIRDLKRILPGIEFGTSGQLDITLQVGSWASNNEWISVYVK